MPQFCHYYPRYGAAQQGISIPDPLQTVVNQLARMLSLEKLCFIGYFHVSELGMELRLLLLVPLGTVECSTNDATRSSLGSSVSTPP